jgi:hypothetical protein
MGKSVQIHLEDAQGKACTMVRFDTDNNKVIVRYREQEAPVELSIDQVYEPGSYFRFPVMIQPMATIATTPTAVKIASERPTGKPPEGITVAVPQKITI